MKLAIFIAKTLLIALLLFLLKHLLQATIEWTDIIPVRPKAYIWGRIDRAIYVFTWQFIFTFWVYILSVILFYFVLRSSFLKNKKTVFLACFLSLLVFLFLLYVHNGHFPYKNVVSTINPQRFNYSLLEEFIIFSSVGFVLIYLTRNLLISNANNQFD